MSLTFDQAKIAAAAERSRVLGLDEWKIALTGAEPQEPLLVKSPDGDYYVVEFRQVNRPSALMLVDRATGEVEAITGIQAPGGSLRFLQAKEIPMALDVYRRKLHTERATESGRYGDFRDGLLADFHPRYLTVEKELVWESCDQSLTPFKPFYKVQHAPPHHIDEFLVRVDGEPFPVDTTDGGRGM